MLGIGIKRDIYIRSLYCAYVCNALLLGSPTTSNHNSPSLSPSLSQNAEFSFLLYHTHLLYPASTIDRAQFSSTGTIYKDYNPSSSSPSLSHTLPYLLHIQCPHSHNKPTNHLPTTRTCHPLNHHPTWWLATHTHFPGSFPPNPKSSQAPTTRSPLTSSGTQSTPSPPPWQLHPSPWSSKPPTSPQCRRQPTPPPVPPPFPAPRVVGKPALAVSARSLLKALYSATLADRRPQTLGVVMSSPGSRLMMRL